MKQLQDNTSFNYTF